MPGCVVSAEFLCNAIVMQQERMSFTHTRLTCETVFCDAERMNCGLLDVVSCRGPGE
jgi:hypothetical protein